MIKLIKILLVLIGLALVGFIGYKAWCTNVYSVSLVGTAKQLL